MRAAAIDLSKFWNPSDPILRFSNAECAAAADLAFTELSGGATRNGKYFRLCGQSGSGKTTQLLPAVTAFAQAARLKPVHLNIENFAKYHPRLDEIRRVYGGAFVRENTNAFALMSLLFALEKISGADLDIILEMTILAPKFEKFITSLLAKYAAEYHIMAVPKDTSDMFIARRAAATGRKVDEKTSDLFYNALIPGLECVHSNAPAIVWSAFRAEPVFVGKISDSDLIPAIEKHRAAHAPELPQEELRAAKIEWFENRAAALQ